MTARMAFAAEFKVLFAAKITMNTATTTTIGSDLNLTPSVTAAFVSDMRLLAIFDVTTAGSTDTTSFVVQDAPDSSGSIGATATAVTSEVSGSGLAGGTGDRLAVVAITLQSGRPWIRLRATGSGATDTKVIRGILLGIPVGLI